MLVRMNEMAERKAGLERPHDPEGPDDLDALMARMARGDSAALFLFVGRFEPQLRSCVLSIALEFGRRDAVATPDERSELVLVAAMVIFERARSWRPGEARPWVWAHRAIRSAVACYIGHATAGIDVDLLVDRVAADAVVTRPDGSAVELVLQLAERDERAAAWWQAAAEVGSERDRMVYLEYEVQQALGDPSPAVTVAGFSGLRPDHVRKIVQRMRARVGRAIEGDDRFAALRDLEWFAA